MRVIVDVKEVLGCATDPSKDIIVTVSNNPYYTFTYDPTATSIAGVSGLQNSLWIYDAQASAVFGSHVWRRAKDANGLTIPLQPYEISSFGMLGTWNAGASAGQLTFTVTILNGSGGEVNTLNNIDYDTVTYNVALK